MNNEEVVQHIDTAVAALKGTTVKYSEWEEKEKAGKYPNGSKWGTAFDELQVIRDSFSVPAPSNPADAKFQALWDITHLPVYSWAAPKVVTSQSALDGALASATAGTRIQAKGFKYSGRFATRALQGPIWLEADPTLEFTAPPGTYGQGIWTVDCSKLYITGFPRVHHCGNQGLLDQGSKDCYYELDIRDCGGTGVLANKATNLMSGTTYKIKGGNNGLDLSLDPHAQKGTGNHFMNSWQLQGGFVLLDIDDQPYGAGFESCALNGTRIAVRAKSLSCDVNKLPPSSSGGRQAGGNAWQPWDGGAPGPHTNCVVEAIAVGSCAQGVYGALSGSGNVNNIVRLGRVGMHRLSPVWAPLPGVTYEDVN